MLLFDFDGTLADTFAMGSRLINEYADKFGYNRIDFEKNKDKSARELVRMSGARWWEIPRMLRFFRREAERQANEICAFAGVPEMIASLREQDIMMGIVSTNSLNTINIFIERHGLQGCFASIRAGVSLFGKKRALRRERQRLRKEGCDSVTYIGDELRDIESCRSIDMPIISCAWGFNSYEILSQNNSRVARSCSELMEYIIQSSKK